MPPLPFPLLHMPTRFADSVAAIQPQAQLRLLPEYANAVETATHECHHCHCCCHSCSFADSATVSQMTQLWLLLPLILPPILPQLNKTDTATDTATADAVAACNGQKHGTALNDTARHAATSGVS